MQKLDRQVTIAKHAAKGNLIMGDKDMRSGDSAADRRTHYQDAG